jgi:hypothetical protein
MLPNPVVMVTVPGAIGVSSPFFPMAATDGSDELQLTCSVTTKQVPSEYVAVAISRSFTPTGMLGISGVTDMKDRVAGFTVRVAVADSFPEITVITVLPGEIAFAMPLLSTVATDESEELQITRVLRS